MLQSPLQQVGNQPVRRPSRASFLVVPTLLFVLLAGCRRAAQPHVQSDELGSPSAAVARVVTLTPSLTEVMFAIGAGDRVVGVSDYCDYPEAARTRPKVGTFLQPSIEKILALRPDLVLCDGVQTEIAAALRQAGARVLLAPMNDLKEVKAAIVSVGEALGDHQPQAAALVRGLETQIDRAAARTRGRPRPRVLFVVDRQLGGLRGLVVAGPGTYLDELLTLSGAENIFADLPLRYSKVALETVSQRRPEVILDAVHVKDSDEAVRAALRDWQALPAVPAVANGRVHVLTGRELVTPGPRLGAAIERLVGLLHPENGPPPAPIPPPAP